MKVVRKFFFTLNNYKNSHLSILTYYRKIPNLENKPLIAIFDLTYLESNLPRNFLIYFPYF